MATAAITYTFSNDTPADADEVNSNFQDVVGFLNNSVIHRDGSKTMTSHLTLPASSPSSDNQATRKKYVDDNDLLRFKFPGTGGTSPIAGSYLSTHQVVLRGGENVGTPDGSGDISVPFTVPFPNGILSVVASLKVAGGTGNTLQAAVHPNVPTVNGFSARVFDPETGTSYTSNTWAVLWIAIGF